MVMENYNGKMAKFAKEKFWVASAKEQR